MLAAGFGRAMARRPTAGISHGSDGAVIMTELLDGFAMAVALWSTLAIPAAVLVAR